MISSGKLFQMTLYVLILYSSDDRWLLGSGADLEPPQHLAIIVIIALRVSIPAVTQFGIPERTAADCVVSWKKRGAVTIYRGVRSSGVRASGHPEETGSGFCYTSKK